MELIEKEGIRYRDCALPRATVESAWFDVLPERERLVLGYTHLKHPATLCVDTSQSLGRAVNSDRMLPTLTPGMHLWLFLPDAAGRPRNRLLTGKEALRLHGFAARYLKDDTLAELNISDGLLKDLCGNSFDAHATTSDCESVWVFRCSVSLAIVFGSIAFTRRLLIDPCDEAHTTKVLVPLLIAILTYYPVEAFAASEDTEGDGDDDDRIMQHLAGL